MPDHTIMVDKDWLPDPDDSLVPEETIAGCLTIKKADKTELTLPFQKYQTMEEVMNALQAAGIIVAFTPYFRGVEPSTALIALKERDINENITLFRRYFFSDEEIIGILRDYYCQVLDFHSVFFNQREIDDDLVGRLIRPSERHMALWVAYHIVEKRRLYEQAAAAIGQSFTDGSDYVGSDVSQSMGTTTTTQIGSVFTITEDPSKGFFYEDFNRVGSDNVLGDRYSFCINCNFGSATKSKKCSETTHCARILYSTGTLNLCANWTSARTTTLIRLLCRRCQEVYYLRLHRYVSY